MTRPSDSTPGLLPPAPDIRPFPRPRARPALHRHRDAPPPARPRPRALLRGGLALALALLAAPSCAPAGSDARLAEQEVLAREIVAAWEAGDADRLAEHFWPDAVYDDFSNAVTYRGLEEILAYKAEIHAWASDVAVNVTAVHPSPGGVVAEWVLYGVHTGPIAGRVEGGTGREILLNGATILEVEGGMVTRAADYLDTLPLMLQLGGRVELPGGEVLELEEMGP